MFHLLVPLCRIKYSNIRTQQKYNSRIKLATTVGWNKQNSVRLSALSVRRLSTQCQATLARIDRLGIAGVSTALAGMIAALLTHSGVVAFDFGLTFGIVAGSVSAIVSVFSPFVEWWADHLPARRMGVFGTVILLLGLILQSIQYWVVLLNIVVQ